MIHSLYQEHLQTLMGTDPQIVYLVTIYLDQTMILKNDHVRKDFQSPLTKKMTNTGREEEKTISQLSDQEK